MLSVLVPCRIEPEHRAAALAVYRELIAETLREPGCLRYELLADVEDPGAWVLSEQWRSQADLDAHAESAHFLRAMASLATLEQAEPAQRLYAVAGPAVDIGFVAGRAPEHLENAEQELLLEAIALLLNWRALSPVTALATLTLPAAEPTDAAEEAEEFRLTLLPGESSWESVSVRTGAAERFDARTGTHTVAGVARLVQPYETRTEALVTRLAFPLSLGIWGRSGDSYRMTGAALVAAETPGPASGSRSGSGSGSEQGDLLVNLAHREDAALTGTLRIDRALRRAVSLDTPTLMIRYREIQPLTAAD